MKPIKSQEEINTERWRERLETFAEDHKSQDWQEYARKHLKMVRGSTHNNYSPV